MLGIDCLEAVDFLKFLENEAGHVFLQRAEFIVHVFSKFIPNADDELVEEAAEVNLTEKLFGELFFVIRGRKVMGDVSSGLVVDCLVG